ncbi:MAG TPA: hypothetical protein VGP07_10875 [Polyangia bacterium]|jgi:hypothetical protein
MTGARLDQNVFQCVIPNIGLRSGIMPFDAPAYTLQGISPSCPQGWGLVGFHQTLQKVACQQFDGLEGEGGGPAEVTDGPGQTYFGQSSFVKNNVRYSTHVCHASSGTPDGVMLGINSSTNIFVCGY